MDQIVRGSISSQIPNWVSKIEKNYSTCIKKINDVVIVHIDEVRLGDQSNKARKQSTLNQSIKNQLRDDFDENDWREDQEPAIIFLNKDVSNSSLSTPKKYDAHLCIHRLTGVKETTGNGSANFQKTFPAVVVELEDGLSSQEVNLILSVFGMEENANRRASNPATTDDYTAGALNMVEDLRVNGREATVSEKIAYLDIELKKMKRMGSTIWKKYQLIRRILKNVRRLLDKDGVAHKRHSFANAQKYVEEYYEDSFEYNTIGKIDNLHFRNTQANSFTTLNTGMPMNKSISLFWPSNRIDRNLNDIYLSLKTMEREDEKVPIHIFLSVDTLGFQDLLHDRKTYARQLLEMRDMLSDDIKERIVFVAFLPQHSSEDLETLIDFRDFQKKYLKDTL